MFQSIQGKNILRLQVVFLLMATMFMPICLASCHVGKSSEKESKAESGEGTSFSRELKLAVVCESVGGKDKSWVEYLVYEYNKTHPDVVITLMPYGEAFSKTDIPMAQLTAQINGEDPPDLILLRNITDNLDALAIKGYMEDLTPYAEKSETVHLEDYYPKVLECGRKEGVLVCIPKYFEIDTVITSKNYFGDATWNYPQLLDFCNAHPNSRFYHNTSPEMLLATLLRESIDYFVDEDQGKCHFDSEEFKSFLEYVGSYSAWGSRTFDPIDSEDYVSSLSDGKVLAWYFYVRNLSNLKDVRMDFGDTANFVGFPNKGGRPVHRIWMDHSTFAITSTSDNKEGAFQFLEWYLALDEDPVLTIDPLRLCANRKEMEEKIEIAIAGRENINGGAPDMTEEDLKTLRILLEGLEPLPDDNLPLYRIAYAEARTYFSGEKSLAEVIDVIQRRATLYLQEK
ncbi:MAG: extracellular solute-binding protein [Lachnospiraceae bacterium]|nr:extracellular solute-binding protein [Lachnospiraceae bacterium]